MNEILEQIDRWDGGACGRWIVGCLAVCVRAYF